MDKSRVEATIEFTALRVTLHVDHKKSTLFDPEGSLKDPANREYLLKGLRTLSLDLMMTNPVLLP